MDCRIPNILARKSGRDTLSGMFDLKKYLEEMQEMVDSYLDQEMPPASTRPTVIHEAMRYSLFAGGKRLRPILSLAASQACGGSVQDAMRPGAAMELFHTFSLIHDDLPAMDDDDLRRGKPTCHIQFGEAISILAGDALHTLGFEWLASSTAHAPYSPTDYVLDLARAGGSQGVVGGQVEDMQAEGKDADADLVNYIHLHKTGDLFIASVRVGAMTGGATSGELAALTRFAHDTGIAFQITDDILNETSTREQMGKSVGNDKEAGKATYPAVHGLEKSRADAERLVEQALRELDHLSGDVTPLKALAHHFIDRMN
jgi:geranylgeranyl diphosphate synthase type II